MKQRTLIFILIILLLILSLWATGLDGDGGLFPGAPGGGAQAAPVETAAAGWRPAG